MRAKRRKPPAITPLGEPSPGGIIARVFGPIYGLPCWNVRPGYGSSLTLEFGAPHLEVREPRQLEDTADEKRKAYHSKRHVFPRGHWHLWIHFCDWKAYSSGVIVSDSDTKEGMELAAEMLDGQRLLSVIVNQPFGHTIFDFDLGGRLVTQPAQDFGDDPGDSWLLFEPNRKVLSFREDGLYSYQYGNTPPQQQRYKAF